MQEKKIIVGLDIGTSKVACIVAEVSADKRITVIGMGTHHSSGLRRGIVVNPEKTVESIQMAIQEAELMADVEIQQVYVGISGAHIQGLNSHGVVAIKTQKVTQDDIERVIDSARAWHLPANQKILHIIPKEYKIDSQGNIRDPLGMCGVRLEARVHIVAADMYAVRNLINCCNRCDLHVAAMVLEQIASSEAVLSQDEKDIGVLLVDIGGGTTDLAVFIDGAIAYTAVIPVGGNHLTHDLLAGLGTSFDVADHLKKKYGSCFVEGITPDEEVEVPQVGGRAPQMMPRQIMAHILEPRVSELFTLIQDKIVESGCQKCLIAGAVFTGGSSLLEGMLDMADQTFDMPVRLAKPQGIDGLGDVVSSPIFSTGVGLLKYGSQCSSTYTLKRDIGLKHRWSSLWRWIGG